MIMSLSRKYQFLVILFTALTINASGAGRRVIVIPVQFNDCSFTMSREEIKNLADSAAVYFTDQFSGAASYIFDTGPAASLKESFAYYGRNSTSRRDEYIYKAVMEACLAIDEVTDFSKYEGIALLAAGISEAEGAGDDHIWPQQGFLSEWGASLCLDGKSIDSFVVTTESSGLGTMCHEYAHTLGLQDLYDTDGASSGGVSKALWGNLSLMDKGDKTGPSPVNFSSIELEQLGIGQCDTLTSGEYVLEPLSIKKRYLKAEADTDGEYYLFECRNEEGWDKNIGCRGLMVYHVDRSDREAGYSYYYRKILTAAERWKYNQVNCMPSYQCAELLPALSDATEIKYAGFPQDGITSFSAGTAPSFRFHSGTASRLALSDIKLLPDGSVSFSVSEPLKISLITSYQDAATVSWDMTGVSSEVKDISVEWYEGDEERGRLTLPSGSCHTIEKLDPDTEYRIYVKISCTDGNSYATWESFRTKPWREGTIPYIDMNDGRRIPLRIINMPNAVSVVWTLDGKHIHTEEDGFYTINRSGVLKAKAEDEEGNINIIQKDLTVK